MNREQIEVYEYLKKKANQSGKGYIERDEFEKRLNDKAFQREVYSYLKRQAENNDKEYRNYLEWKQWLGLEGVNAESAKVEQPQNPAMQNNKSIANGGGVSDGLKTAANIMSYVNPLTASARLAYDVVTHPKEVKDWTKSAAGVVGDAVSSMFSDKDSYTGIKDSELPNHISKRSKSFKTLSDEDKTEHLKQKFYLLSGKKDKPGEGMAQTDYLKSIANSKPVAGGDVLTGGGQTINTNLYGYTQDEIDYANKVIKNEKDNIVDTKKKLKEVSEFAGQKIKDAERNKNVGWVAKKLYDDAKDMADAPFRGDLDDTNAIANYGRGVKSGARAENIPFAGAVYSKRVEDETQEALKAFNKAQENWAKSHKQGDEMTAEDVKKAIGEDKFEIVSAAYTLAEVSQMRENNLSLAYQSGQSLAQSLSMMAEMLIARKALGRVFGKVGKMDKVLDKKMARNWKNGNYGSAAGNFMQQRLINAPSSAVATVPMAVKNIEQAETEKAMQGEDMTAKDYISATADAAIETFTETGGGKLLDIGNDALKKQAGRAFKNTLGKTKAWKFVENMGGKLPKDFKRYVNFVRNTDIANEVLQSPLSEYQEEFLGAGLGLAKGTLLGGEYYEDAKDEMAYMLSREGNVVTAGSVLPMTLLPSFVGGGLKMAAAKRSAKAVGKYGKILTDQIDKMDISDDEKSEKKKKLADYITSRQGNLDDNEAEYIAGQIGLDAQSISTLKRYANSVKSYYETGDIDTLTKDMSEEDKQSVGAMLAAWWKVRFDGANERYNNYVSAKDNLRKATEARDELVKNLGGKKSAIARLQELNSKYKNGNISSEEEAELRVLMNVDIQEAEERYMDAYELMRNPNVKTKQESSEQQEEQPAEQARKVTKVKYTTNHNGTTVVSTITDEDGFTDEEIRRGVVVKNHPNATLENDRTAEPVPLSQTGLSKVHVELSDEDKSQREEERRVQEEREKEERRQMKAESRAAKREEERARIASFPEMADKSVASWIRRNYTPNEVTTEDGIADDIADMLGDESDGDTMTNKLESVAEFINPELIDIFRSLARKVDDGTISVKDFVSAFGVNQEQNNAESAEVERKSENLSETIEGMDAVEARELLRTKVGELTEVMRKESMAIANLQSQVDSDKASDELKARQSENIKTHREVLKKAEEDYQAVMTTIMSMDEGLFNELSSAPVKSSSEARALEALGVRVDERKKDEANPNRAGMTKDGKDILDGVNAMREQGKSDEQIAQELAAEYEYHDRLVTDIKGQLNGKVLLSKSVNLQRSMAYHEKVLGEILSIAEQQGGSVEESFFNAIEENEIDGVPERLEKTQNEASAKDEADAVIEDMAKNNPAGLISMADNQIEKTLSDLSKKMLRRHDIEEGNVAADVNDLAKILKDIKKLNANLEKWENIRQQYSEDGKSMKEGTLSAEERMKIELNNRENNKEQVADTQEERVEQKETTEERKARKLKETEERRAAELKEKQKQAEETLAAAREKYEAEKAAEESDTEEQSELPTSSESPVIEETDSAEENNDGEESGETQEVELLSDGEIAKYEDDIFYGLFDGEQDADDKYLNQARSDLEQTEGQIEEKKAKVSNAEEIIKEMEEDPDFWTSNGVDPNEGIAKYKESIAKLSDDIEWLNKTKAETERYIASKEAQMRANEKKGSNESGGESTVDAAELSRSFLDIMNKWFNERRYDRTGTNKGFRHTETVRGKMISTMVGIRPDGMAASDFTEYELKLMDKIAEACININTAGKKRKINVGEPNEREVETTDISDEIREKISKAWAKVTEEEINDGNTDAENAMKNLMNKLIYGVDEEEKEEGADAGEKKPLTQKEKDNLESEMKKYLKRRFDGEQRDARFEDEDGTLYIDYGEGKQKVYFKKFARGFSLRTSPNEEYYDSVESWKNKDEKKKEQDRVSRGDVKTQEEYEKWQRRQALGVQVPNGKMALIFQSEREIEGAVKRNDGSYSVTNAMMEKLVNGKLTEADFGLDGDLPVRTFNEFVNAIKRASGIDYSDPLIASAIRLSITGMNKAANNGFGNGTNITVEKKDHLNSSEAKDEIWNENFKDTKYEITEHNGVYYLSNHEYKNPNEAGIKLRERIIGDLKAKGIKVGSDEYAAAVKARKESMETQGLLKLSLNDAMKVLDRLTMEKPQTEEEKEEEDKIVDDDIETTGDELDAYQSSEYDRKVSTEGVYDSENSDIVNDHLSQWDEEKKTKAKPAATKKRTKAEAAAIKKLNEFVEKKEEAMADYQKARKEGNKEAQKEAIERQKKINKEAQAFAKVNGIDWRAEGYSFHIDKKNIITETAKRYGKQMMSHIKKVANASKGRLTSSSFSEMMKGDPRGEFAKAVKEYARANHITPAQAAKEIYGQRGNARMMAEESPNVQLMEGSDGTVYGWCEIERDAEGNVVARHIYLNDEVLNANTMVHELGHLWLNLLSEINPKLYEHGLSLAKQHLLFAELKASDEYGMLSDDEIADEVLARMIGDRFEVLTEFAETKYSSGSELKNVISALRRFFVDMFKSIKSAFGEWTDEEIDNTTLTDIATSAVRDIISGKTVEEWAAKTISDDVHEKLRNTSQPSLTVDEVEKAISIAEKLSVKHGAANFIQNFCKVLTKKGRGTLVTEAIDNNKPILLLYKAIDRFRRSIGMDGLDMKECPYYDYEAIGQTIKTESSDANQRLIENGIKKTTTAAVEVLSKLKLRNGEEIGKEKARKLLDIYLMSHSAVERKQKGYNTRSAEALLSSSDVSWIKEIDGFENVSNEDTLVESVIRLQALNTDVRDAINNQWEAIRAITSYYRDLLYDSGYISADLRNEWSNEYYVPNKGVYGDKEDEDDDRDSILDELISRGLIEGDRSKNSARSLTTRSKGGESFGEDCIANLISQMDAAIRVSTVNRFRLKIFKDLIDNSAFGERTGLFTIRKGEARTDDRRARSIVMVGGETYTIDWGSEENYAIADAVNGSKNRIKVLRNTTNGLRAFGSTIFTTLNVSFVLSEIKRQYLTRASQMYMTFAEKYGVKKAVAKWAESFFRPDRYIRVQKTLCAALLKHESDSDIANKSGIMRYFKEFQMYAGNAGFTTSEAFVDYMSLKDISKEISGIGAGVNKHSASIYLKKIYNALTLIQRTNDVTNRYLAFAMLMESGWTARDAARVSRNVGPNFLRGGRGEYGFAVPSQYSIFYNATLQGQMNALSKYFGRTTFDGEYLSKKRYVRKLAAASFALSLYAIYGYLVGQTGVGLILSMFGGDDDDDKKNHGIKEEAWLKGSRDKDFAYSGIMRYADDSGPWLKILTTIPEEDRVIFTIGVNVALRENGLITESELCSRVAKACVDGAIPISNVFKGLAYGVIDAADNFINGKGKDLEAIMISNFANGVLNDISAPVEMMGFWLDDKKYVEDVADRDDAASKLPNFAYSYTEGGHYFANKIAMNDARFADFFAYGSGIVTTIDKNLELLGIDDDTRVSKYEQEQFKKYASSEAKQIDAGRIKIDRGNVYKLNEITKNLGRLSELKWELNPEEKEMYEVVTGDKLKKKKTVNYSLTKNDLLEAKEISKFYVDYSSSIKDENIVLSPEAYSEKIKMKQEEFKNKPRKRKLAVLSLAKRVFADKAKTDLYEDNFNKTMDYCDEYRKSHNDEPSNLEVAIVCKLYGKYIKDLGKAAKDAINVATIKLLPDDLWKPNLMNVGELSKDNVKAKEYLSSESYDAKLEDNASFVSRYENVTEQIREELFKLTEYRDKK